MCVYCVDVEDHLYDSVMYTIEVEIGISKVICRYE